MMPQHLQLQDRYHEQLLDQRLSAISGNFWGVSQLDVDADQLARGMFQLANCTAVMPDGLLLQIGQQAPLKGLSVMTPTGGLTGDAKRLELYLSVPSHSAGGATAEAETAGTRYHQRSETLPDYFGEAQDAGVDCVLPNARLLLGQDNRQNYVTIKVAELVLNESGRVMISEAYVPPCLKIRAAPTIMRKLGQLVSALGSKQRHLVDKYGGRTAALVEFGAADMATFWYLHTINSWLPIFMHYSASGDIHPEQLYLALASFVGQLSSFEATSDPLDIPTFNFTDLAGTLYPLFDRTSELMGTVVSSRYKPIPLEQTQPGLFVGKVDDPTLLQRTLYLVAGGDVPDDKLRADVPRYVKVGSIDQIAQIVQSSLPGVAVRMDLAPPNAIPVRAHMVYLQLDQNGKYWKAVSESGTIAIYQPVKPSRVKLELLAVEV